MRASHFIWTTVLALLSGAVTGHPGNGIVAMSSRSVLTGDALQNGLWRFERGKAPARLTRSFHCHWVTRGLDGRLYAETLHESGGAWKTAIHRLGEKGMHPEALAGVQGLGASVFAVDEAGRIIFALRGIIVATQPTMRPEPFRGSGRVAKGEPELAEVHAFAWGPDRTLYLAEENRIRKVGLDGVIRLVKTFDQKPSNALYAGRSGSARVWGLAVDAGGRIFAALPSLGRVVRIDRNGKSAEVARTANDWAATGVATQDGVVFLLESRTVGNQNQGPRVRAILPDGAIETLGVAR